MNSTLSLFEKERIVHTLSESDLNDPNDSSKFFLAARCLSNSINPKTFIKKMAEFWSNKCRFENVTKEDLCHAQFWVQTHRLPFLSKSRALAKKVGEWVGEFIDVHEDSLHEGWGSFMRTGVRIDVTQPLMRVKMVTLPQANAYPLLTRLTRKTIASSIPSLYTHRNLAIGTSPQPKSLTIVESSKPEITVTNQKEKCPELPLPFPSYIPTTFPPEVTHVIPTSHTQETIHPPINPTLHDPLTNNIDAYTAAAQKKGKAVGFSEASEDINDTCKSFRGKWTLIIFEVFSRDVAATKKRVQVLMILLFQHVSVFYDASETHLRINTWNLLSSLVSNDPSIPWLVLGDFNEFLSNEDKEGGPPQSDILMGNFRKTIDTCKLRAIPFNGDKFTWTNMNHNGNFVRERLDRGFFNDIWFEFFIEARVTHLDFYHSDHRAIEYVVSTPNLPATNYKRQTRFCFEQFWLKDSECRDIIQSNCGGTVQTKEEIVVEIDNYFSNLFSSNCVDDDALHSVLATINTAITAKMNQFLLQPYTVTEGKSALNSMAPDKSPEVDGMSAIFFQHHWDIVGTLVTQSTLRILNEGDDMEAINSALITLIPKIDQPKFVRDYRPISLYTVLYKLVSKAIAARFKEALPHVIFQNQSAFLPNRLITDNAVLVKQAWRILENPSSLLARVLKACYFKNAHYISTDRQWDARILKHHFGAIDVKRIFSIPLSPFPREDMLIWDHSDMGLYTVKSGYHLAKSLESMNVHSSSSSSRQWWNRFWSLRLPKKVKIFAWRFINDALPTSVNLAHRKITSSRACALCKCAWESVGHAIFRVIVLRLCGESSISMYLYRILPPAADFFKLNMDAARDQAGAIIGIGALIRDHDDTVVASFSKPIRGCFSPKEMESAAMFHSVKWAIEHQLQI
uniref:Reverse transcriptase zinc-binding domain-containing protein n=1 Tax=Cannabis sativa TaxID=3483 RepID=A0A803QJE5_CANSA